MHTSTLVKQKNIIQKMDFAAGVDTVLTTGGANFSKFSEIK